MTPEHVFVVEVRHRYRRHGVLNEDAYGCRRSRIAES